MVLRNVHEIDTRDGMASLTITETSDVAMDVPEATVVWDKRGVRPEPLPSGESDKDGFADGFKR